MLYVDSEDKLVTCLEILKNSDLIGIDTEFVRRETYFAKLSLVQIATLDEVFLLDPLAVKLDNLSAILIDEKITKIFHAPHQDLGIFYHDYHIITRNIFDLQSAIKFLGIRNQISYQDACASILNINIDKTQQFREWNIRPIPQDMIEYAAQDVIYLIAMYHRLKKMMEEKGNFKNFCYYMHQLFEQEGFYQVNFDEIWKKIKLQGNNIEITNKLKLLAAFREELAISLDMPRTHIISDHDLLSLSIYLPSSENDLRQHRIRIVHNPRAKSKILDFCSGLRSNNKSV